MGFPHAYCYFVCDGWLPKMGEEIFLFQCSTAAAATGSLVLSASTIEFITFGNCFVIAVPEFEKISNDSVTRSAPQVRPA
jgi:hypothetical protein